MLLYFSGLGAGYMFAEIGLMLRAHALLGHPVLAAGVVLTGLLVASGVGSLCSDRIPATTPAQRRVTASVVAGLLAVSAVLTLLTPHARAWPAATFSVSPASRSSGATNVS